ncbi:hypothetical protein [Haloterrigena sp. H1]|uniref:hypothetical protein n=1 Tax=Haloterrigena sp. H1 TaxID=2552943 RepID=UPI0014869262|nr:hypothetical protein [Haloterrigena sp. H1]
MSANTDCPEPDAQTLQTLADELERLHERVTTLENELSRKDDLISRPCLIA